MGLRIVLKIILCLKIQHFLSNLEYVVSLSLVCPQTLFCRKFVEIKSLLKH